MVIQWFRWHGLGVGYMQMPDSDRGVSGVTGL